MATSLFALLGAVVVRLTQRLFGASEEELGIVLIPRVHVVTHRGGSDARQAHDAERVGFEVLGSNVEPASGAIELPVLSGLR